VGSYWFIPRKLLADFYPGSKDSKEATIKLTAIINDGIQHVINLMERDERDFTGQRFVRYDDMMEFISTRMGISITFNQLPIKDLSVPTELRCYLVRHGLATGKNVLDIIGDLRKDIENSDKQSPETREQREMVVGWEKKNTW
jgi:hypothetical protein